MYTIDWSDIQHCHNPNTELWDRTNGRLYRVSWAATFKPAHVNLGAKSDAELAALHTHRNEWHVRMARRLLQERAAHRPLEARALATRAWGVAPFNVYAATETNHYVITVTNDEVEFWCNDNDMFWGHAFSVEGTLERGITRVTLEG